MSTSKADQEILLPDSLNLSLPDAPDFISEPPKFTLLEMIEMCEKMLPYWNEQRFGDGRLPEKIIMPEPFVLD